MPNQNDIAAQMDKAAALAKKDLVNKLADMEPGVEKGFIHMAEWFYTWYMQAGSKRLGRILVNLMKEHLTSDDNQE